ncbi:MAG TPA: hypothetical protein VFT67_08830 [Jatrophihabitantaceae bacterium]|nr:hypothetical protein [Jatrophihabitantaceae bacterium]
MVKINDTHEEPVRGVTLEPVRVHRVAKKDKEVLERRDRSSTQRTAHDVSSAPEAAHPEGKEVPLVRELPATVLVLQTVRRSKPNNPGVISSIRRRRAATPRHQA